MAATNDFIHLSHGSGGRATHELLHRLIFPALGIESSTCLDSAIIDLPIPNSGQLAFTTDGFVVQPIQFPGGDIGKLAVCGTINDLAVMGAQPALLALGLIIEEGLSVETLRMVLKSVAREAAENNVKVVAGDTKVVRKGEADQLFATTTGIGIRCQNWNLHPGRIAKNDKILLSGTMGEHGSAILAARGSFGLEGDLVSDCTALWPLVDQLHPVSEAIHFMRDPTRGGVAAALHEALHGSALGAELDESRLPVRPEVSAFSEILGIDPLYLACEGRLLLVVEQERANEVLAIMRSNPLGRAASEVGAITSDEPGKVTLRNPYGSRRFVESLAGDQLPRIC